MYITIIQENKWLADQVNFVIITVGILNPSKNFLSPLPKNKILINKDKNGTIA